MACAGIVCTSEPRIFRTRNPYHRIRLLAFMHPSMDLDTSTNLDYEPHEQQCLHCKRGVWGHFRGGESNEACEATIVLSTPSMQSFRREAECRGVILDCASLISWALWMPFAQLPPQPPSRAKHAEGSERALRFLKDDAQNFCRQRNFGAHLVCCYQNFAWAACWAAMRCKASRLGNPMCKAGPELRPIRRAHPQT